MVPIIKEKIVSAVEDLEMYLEENAEHEDLKETERLTLAQEQIAAAHQFLEGLEEAEQNEEITEGGVKTGDNAGDEADKEKNEEGSDDDDEEMPMGDDDDDEDED